MLSDHQLHTLYSDPEQDLGEKEARLLVREALTKIKDRERKVLELRFGFYDGEERTLKAVGEEMGGLSRERVRQLQNLGLRRIQHPDIVRSLRDVVDPMDPEERRVKDVEKALPNRILRVRCKVCATPLQLRACRMDELNTFPNDGSWHVNYGPINRSNPSGGCEGTGGMELVCES